MTLQRTYYPAQKCSGGPTPGAKALMSWWLGAYGGRGATNLGIYNCRPIDGTSTLSLHGEGRADDLGVPVGNAWSFAVADALKASSAELGVQLVIHNGKVWSARQPDAGWRTYNGSNPHRDHLHVELTPDAAQRLDVPYINAVLRPASPSVPGDAGDWTEELVKALPTARLGHHDVRTVKTVQAIINRDAGAGTLLEDGNWGPKTDNAVRTWQVVNNVPNSVRKDGTGDGVFGRASWTYALTLA